jgi:hypothetical protein
MARSPESHPEYVHSRHDGEEAEHALGRSDVGGDTGTKKDESKDQRTKEDKKSGAGQDQKDP